jgi:hypothetical protein
MAAARPREAERPRAGSPTAHADVAPAPTGDPQPPATVRNRRAPADSRKRSGGRLAAVAGTGLILLGGFWLLARIVSDEAGSVGTPRPGALSAHGLAALRPASRSGVPQVAPAAGASAPTEPVRAAVSPRQAPPSPGGAAPLAATSAAAAADAADREVATALRRDSAAPLSHDQPAGRTVSSGSASSASSNGAAAHEVGSAGPGPSIEPAADGAAGNRVARRPGRRATAAMVARRQAARTSDVATASRPAGRRSATVAVSRTANTTVRSRHRAQPSLVASRRVPPPAGPQRIVSADPPAIPDHEAIDPTPAPEPAPEDTPHWHVSPPELPVAPTHVENRRSIVSVTLGTPRWRVSLSASAGRSNGWRVRDLRGEVHFARRSIPYDRPGARYETGVDVGTHTIRHARGEFQTNLSHAMRTLGRMERLLGSIGRRGSDQNGTAE